MPYKDEKKRKECWKQATRRYQQWWAQWKLDQRFSCNRCGFDKHPAAIQFHHKDRKIGDKDVAMLVRLHRPLVEIIEEIEKCEVLCANCHAIEHAKIR